MSRTKLSGTCLDLVVVLVPVPSIAYVKLFVADSVNQHSYEEPQSPRDVTDDPDTATWDATLLRPATE